VVAATDMVAAGALTALHEAGLDVPGDVSPAGYDDIPFVRDLRPALTTVHVPYEELGRLAGRTALGHAADSPGEHLLLGTHVVVRDSVAAIEGEAARTGG
jgi:LacI family transcriptional regulator